MRVLVTGGAGFIGSHLVEKLSKKHDVIVYDNFSSGKKEFLKGVKCEVIKGDILNLNKIVKVSKNVDIIYHLAADPDVRKSYFKPVENFEIDARGTLNVLEAARRNDVKKFVFSSSSVVYGIAKMPTPEDAPIKPISNYGAAKASSENYMMSYSNLYGIKCLALRYANIIGPRLTHGIIYDFYNKLKKNPKKLEILGDGTQKKSYLHVKDCVNATVLAAGYLKKSFDVYNIGSEEQITVKEIAKIVSKELGLNPKFIYKGGKIGWPGDVPKMLLSTKKIKKIGWKPKYSIRDAIVDTLNYLRGRK